jgi:hypothetical protein
MTNVRVMHTECDNCKRGHLTPCRRSWDEGGYRYACGCDCPEGAAAPQPRTILVHLNIEIPADDSRTPNQVADAIEAALSVVADHDSLAGMTITCPMAEED